MYVVAGEFSIFGENDGKLSLQAQEKTLTVTKWSSVMSIWKSYWIPSC